MPERVYLDWNATAPLRPEARAAMLEAMDVLGNPSSVHAEGRAARGLVERARGQIARLVGCEASEIVFTSGATEAAALVLASADAVGPPTEHDCVYAWAGRSDDQWQIDQNGQPRMQDRGADDRLGGAILAVATSNGETGVLTDDPDGMAGNLEALPAGPRAGHILFRDAAQSIGRVPVDFRRLNASFLS
ncbi:MAG: aminotransferase class V-fold PLP-dependent enzyme, partial [Pseudomonadota bacterium]